MNMKNKYFLLLKEIYLEKALAKLNLLAFVYMLASVLSFLNTDFLEILLFFTSFMILYSSVYYYNDLSDYNSDKKMNFNHKSKLLVKGFFTKKEYKNLFIFSTVSGIVLLWIINTFYAFLSFLLVIFNHLRTKYLKTLPKRIFSLFWVQFFNLVIFWFVLTKQLFNVFVCPLFTLYSFAYTLSYYFYKKNMNVSISALLKFLPLFLLFIYFALPILLEKLLIIPLAVGATIYVLLIGINREKHLNDLMILGLIAITLSTLIFISYPFFEKELPRVNESLPQEIRAVIYDTPEFILESLQENYSKYASFLNTTLNFIDFSILKTL